MRITKRKTRVLALASAAAITTLMLPASPAASHQSGGVASVAFDGTATLRLFPDAQNQGNFEGEVTDAAVAGLHHGEPFAATGSSGVVFSDNFTYNEPLGCSAGLANGRAHVENVILVTPLGSAHVGDVWVTFQWARVGATAAIALTDVEAEVDGHPFIVDGVGEGTAAFTLAEEDIEPACNPTGDPVENLEAHVTGVATVTGAAP